MRIPAADVHAALLHGPGQRRVKAFASAMNAASGNEASSFTSSCRRPELSACVSPRKRTEASRSRAVVASVVKRVQECPAGNTPTSSDRGERATWLAHFLPRRPARAFRETKAIQRALTSSDGSEHRRREKPRERKQSKRTEGGREEPTHMRSNPLIGQLGPDLDRSTGLFAQTP